SNDRLRCEVFEQRDLLVGKQPNLLAAGDNQSEEADVFAQRHIQRRAYASVKRGASDRIGGITYIRHLHNASAAQQLTDRMRWAGQEALPQPIGKACFETSCRYRAVFLTVIDGQAPNLRAAQGMRLFQYRVEHRRKIAGR